MTCFPQTLEHALKGGGSLKLQCGCGHRAAFAAPEALKLFGPRADPIQIRRRARCRLCGARNPGRVWV